MAKHPKPPKRYNLNTDNPAAPYLAFSPSGWWLRFIDLEPYVLARIDKALSLSAALAPSEPDATLAP